MKIVYQNENDFLKPSFSSFSHKLLEDSKYYYHILDKEDEHFNYLKETEPEKLSILNQIKDLQNFLTTNELIFDTKTGSWKYSRYLYLPGIYTFQDLRDKFPDVFDIYIQTLLENFDQVKIIEIKDEVEQLRNKLC